MKILKFCIFLSTLSPTLALAGNQIQQHDPIASVIIWVALIFFFSVIGRYLALYFNQPAVLGELLMGVILGNLCYFFGLNIAVVLREGPAILAMMGDLLSDIPLAQAVNLQIPNSYYANQVIAAFSSAQGIDYMKIAFALDIFARYGVILLLFKVGLESSIQELKQTGTQSLRVAILGVLAPILLGFALAALLIPNSDYKTHLFVAATLSATSIGITARVLSEMKKLGTSEAKTILGAAMIDDILGLIILAVVSSIVVKGSVDLMMVSQLIVLSVLFFAILLSAGPWIVKKSIRLFRFLDPWELKLFIAFTLVMTLAWLASVVHLATIIGAFAAGLILHDDFFDSSDSKKNPQKISHLMAPLETILAPLFFMLIGIQVKLETFLDMQVLKMAGGLIFAAILGKLISGLGASRKDDRLLVGIGMIPRGEVGLVFASIGRTLGVMSDQLFTSIVLMVIVTTFIAPSLLKARYESKKD